MSEQSYRLPYIRLVPGQDDDLITWLASLEGEPQGVRGQRYKEIVRLGLRASGELPWGGRGLGPAIPGSALDTEALLGDIRRVMEAVIESALARGVTLGAGSAGEAAPTAPLTDDWLGGLLGNLLLGADDE